MEDKQCLLVIIGAKEHGQKELIADGYRESAQSGLEAKNRRVPHEPKLGIGDGTLDFSRALFQGLRESPVAKMLGSQDN